MARLTLMVAPLLAATSTLALAQTDDLLQKKLDTVVDGYSLSQPDLARSFIAVAQRFRIPMGIEWIASQTREPVSASWKRTTPREVIESLVKSEPAYEVDVGEQIVHVFYRAAKSDRSNFLNLPIPELTLQHTYVGIARSELKRVVRTTVLAQTAPAPGKPVSVGGSIPLDPGDEQHDFRWEQTNVREVLDDLTLAGHYNIWVATFADNPRQSPHGFRATLSLWIPSARPDDSPDWDSFDWQHPPPEPQTGGIPGQIR